VSRRILPPVVLGLAACLSAAVGQTPRHAMAHGAAPAVSPDGSRIAFLSDRDGATDVYVISADGTGELRLTEAPETETRPQWSRDGKEIWFAVFANDVSSLWAVDAAGRSRRSLGHVPGRAMRLSSDGKSVLYWVGSWTAMKLSVSGLDGSNARLLTDGSGVVYGARWSPDGQWIAFADRDSQRVLHVFVMKADGSDRRQVSHFAPSDGQAQMPAWSPDGSLLAVQATSKGGPGHIWILDVATGAARKLAAHDRPYQDEVPAWFPDGKRIAFQSDRTGRMEIWIMAADGSGALQVTR
jgi:TolB protein